MLFFTSLTYVVLQKNNYILNGNHLGEYHKMHDDEKRDNKLEHLGFIVLRFENKFVF
jgi:very-short-patch-repair endonuclease